MPVNASVNMTLTESEKMDTDLGANYVAEPIEDSGSKLAMLTKYIVNVPTLKKSTGFLSGNGIRTI